MIKDIEGLIEHLKEEIKSNIDTAVLGMSGGADSTLVSILCREALGAKNVYSVHMPFNEEDNQTFNAHSRWVAEKLGIHIINIRVNDISQAIVDSIQNGLKVNKLSIVNAGNARSRARMTVLYGVAHHLNEQLNNRVRVIGTGNCSEDQADYQTKFGDSAADIFPIGDLYKSEIYQLLEYFRDKDYISELNINRVPSAGLWEGQTDKQELGYSYDEMEPFLKDLLKNKPSSSEEFLKKFTGRDREIAEVVVKRYYSGKHKTEAPPVISLRQFCD